MNLQLAATLVLYALFLTVWCSVAAAQKRALSASLLVAIIALELALALQAVADLGVLILGHRQPEHLIVHLSYLLCSVVMLPVFVSGTVGHTTPDGHTTIGAMLLLSGGCLLTGVVTARLYATWYPLRTT